eukprot:EG_transcript_3777
MAAAVVVSPTFNALFEVGAVFTCLNGCHSSLLLAAASIRLRLPSLMVLSALQFAVQSIFSLHFVAMCGMQFGVEWGFDVGLTCASLACVVLFGTAAITLTLCVRWGLQLRIEEEFGAELASPTLGLYPRLLAFIVVHVLLLRLLLAVVLMVVGAAGCHHVGMWSIHGLAQGHLTSQLTYWSFLTTVAVGGVVCVLAVLAFLLAPEGAAAVLAAGLLTGGIAAFHFCSALWGMQYVSGVEGVTSKAVMGMHEIVLFVLLQGALGQVITTLFTRTALAAHETNLKQLATAQTLGQYIRDMDLKPAQALQLETPNPSELERTLFGIVDNLLLYRPYLPDTLFQPRAALNETPAEVTDCAVDRTSTVSLGTLSEHTIKGSPMLPRQHSGRRAAARPALPLGLSSEAVRGAEGRPAAPNMALGLQPVRLTVLRIRLRGLEYGAGKAVDVERVEEHLTRFMALATAQVKANGGTIVSCASGAVVAMWATVSPEAALDTALALQQLSDASLVQVVQSGVFLTGNLAADSLRAFNMVGPLDWPGRQLLRLDAGGQHVFVTAQEWQHVRYKYQCLPVEQVLVHGEPTTVYAVLPPPVGQPEEEDNEWMYRMAEHSGKHAAIDLCWQAYLRGDYAEVRRRAPELPGSAVPPWYPPHLLALARQATECRAKLPAKSLDTLGWPAHRPHNTGLLSDC